MGSGGRRRVASRRWVGGSRTRSGEQGQAAQRRAAHGPVGLGVAAKRSSGCALGPLRDRDAKHPSAGSGFRGLPGQAGRDLHAGEGLVQEGEEWSRALWGTNRTGGSWERPGSPVARRPPSAHRPGPDHCGSEPDWPPEPLPVKSGTAPSPSLESSPLRVPRVAALWPLGAFPPFLAAEVGTGGLSSACELPHAQDHDQGYAEVWVRVFALASPPGPGGGLPT